ncbi:hypothetical protein [Mucilaginibacter sp.]|uniref:hypothetical protein n=1 Tax=Mucilaginibacter sp. TaxID=1882438 RepID=UPI00260B5341|nr:hypothetical protein [Mucilaginibacter sp.]MDB5032682.1 hypothetical protein [Mucilaginibacter sp.]
MKELHDEVSQFKKLVARLTMFCVVSKNLRDGQNGFFLKRMKRFKQRLLAEINGKP